MQMKKDSCDCYIGKMNNEFLLISTIQYELEKTSRLQKVYKNSNLFKDQKTLTPLELVDNRKGYVSRFVFCPYCGTKVDWKTIVNNLR